MDQFTVIKRTSRTECGGAQQFDELINADGVVGVVVDGYIYSLCLGSLLRVIGCTNGGRIFREEPAPRSALGMMRFTSYGPVGAISVSVIVRMAGILCSSDYADANRSYGLHILIGLGVEVDPVPVPLCGCIRLITA